MAASLQISAEVKSKQDFDPNEVFLRKRLPRKFPKRHNDVYVNTKTNFVAQMKRCEKLLDNGESEIYIHGLGLAVQIAMNIALQLEQKYGTFVKLSVNTSTVELLDDLEPLIDDVQPDVRERSNSAIHIKITKDDGLSSEVQEED